MTKGRCGRFRRAEDREVAKRQFPTAPVRGTTDACDPDVQKAVKLPQFQHTERIIDVRAVIQHQTAIRTVQEKAELLQSQQLDRAADVAVEIQPMYSRRSPSVKLGGAGTERSSRHPEARVQGDC